MPKREAVWKTKYREQISSMSSVQLVDEIVERTTAIGDEFYDERAAWQSDYAAEFLKTRLTTCPQVR